jgi:NADPH:quinone reductase-like Zn-dependent oxidoreductase
MTSTDRAAARTHRRVTFQDFGDLGDLQIEEAPTPYPGPDEVLVRVEAAAVNHLDLDMLRGISRYSVTAPHTLGMEAAGTVESIGPHVTGVSRGDRVMVACDIVCRECEYCVLGWDNLCPHAHRPGWTHPGAYAEMMIAPARGLYPLPDTVSFEAAAALQIGLGTAWHMLITRGGLQAGEWVLINGAAGSIGLAALQLAKLAGARVIAASASVDKRHALLADGADATADYTSASFVADVREITGGRGVDIVYEHVGGDLFARSLECLRPGGRLLTCGGHGGEISQLDIIPFFRRELTIIGSNSATQRDIRLVLELVSGGRLQPVIAGRFPLERAADALALLDRRQNYGRVLILPAMESR